MRILMVTQDFPPVVGGIQTYAYALAREFNQRCEAFAVVAPSHPDQEAVDRACPYPVHRVPVSSDWMRVAALPWMMSVALQGRYDTLVLAQWYPAWAAQLMRRLGIVERVYSAAHGQELCWTPLPDTPVGWLYERHRGETLRACDGLFPVSHFTGGVLQAQGVPPSRIHVAMNGTYPERFKLDTTAEALAQWRQQHGLGSGPMLLTVCRLVHRKGIDLVLEAMPAVLRRFPEACYAVVGGGPERERLEKQARAFGVEGQVRFLGRLDDTDLLRAFYASDLFVMPARMAERAMGPWAKGLSFEGFGLTFREANACGKPVIGARTGGVPDAIEDGVTGLLIDEDDRVGLEAAILELL
ncbi:MAG: glycosyltransferase family 4 protein, partial [Myxococcota bacterium]